MQTDKTKESVVEFMKELRGIAGEKPISEAEFTNACLSKARGYAQQFEGYQSIAAVPGTSLLLVGDLSKIEDGIRELNLGEVVILDVEGRPVVK